MTYGGICDLDNNYLWICMKINKCDLISNIPLSCTIISDIPYC